MAQSLIVGVPCEADPDERHVSIVPSAVTLLQKAGAELLVQKGAGLAAGFTDDIKRSLSSGFAGIANPLFALDHSRMLYADGKKQWWT